MDPTQPLLLIDYSNILSGRVSLMSKHFATVGGSMQV